MIERTTFERTDRSATPLLTVAAVAAAGALLLLAGAGALAAQGSVPEEPAHPNHPDVGETAETCVTCHQQATPEIYQAWFAGKHGLNSVKCFVCHGSRTERFAVEVTTGRCNACHSDQIDSMEALSQWTGMEDATCFSCHPPHRLSPHASTLESSDDGEGGAR